MDSQPKTISTSNGICVTAIPTLSELLIAQSKERVLQLLQIAAPSEDDPSAFDPEVLGDLVTTLNSLPIKEYKIVEQLLKDFHSCDNDDQRSMIRLELDRYLGAKTVTQGEEIVPSLRRSSARALDVLQEMENIDASSALSEFSERLPKGHTKASTIEYPSEIGADDFNHSAHAIHRMKVGDRIRRMRQKKYLKQTTLAERTKEISPPGLSQSHISKLERGEYTPTYLTIEKLAKAFGCKMSDLDESYD